MNERAAPVKQYLAALRSGDWKALAATLHPDVVRHGPYRDVVRGRDEYRDFLAHTISALDGYELTITRVLPTSEGAVVELSETVDEDGGRVRTDEAVVFDVDDGLIVRVAVYLQKRHRLSSG